MLPNGSDKTFRMCGWSPAATSIIDISHRDTLSNSIIRLDLSARRGGILYPYTSRTHSNPIASLHNFNPTSPRWSPYSQTCHPLAPLLPNSPRRSLFQQTKFLGMVNSNDSKIPKPDGEAGRPAHGGYNLERALNWDSSRFKLLRDFVHRLIDSHCDTSKSKSSQTTAALNSVETEAVVQFPELNDYMGRWPVGDLIQMQLKNLSAKEQQRHAKNNNSHK
ncbi:hypothetical protein DFJ58DRAFT_848375 [Suillus subalutaceus]|uniref:uncharacterized protein n=1 Tax=Suillus subalutaceus TaxID=48586 RepID=UPI001B8641D6|nr:uncharacterized protein DFJ58DRAFT_848375 [Suillus subalutaceus]KAG1830939.1 hypothetical protein DFJ58DRAFT_848375 [Suillus subalutaceus]